MSDDTVAFTTRQERALLDIVTELYATGRFATYQALAAAIRFPHGQQAFVRAIIASSRICHDHSSRIVSRNGRGGALASTRVATETRAAFAPAAHLRDDEHLIAKTGRIPPRLLVNDVATLRSFCRADTLAADAPRG